jgi:iron(III)-enterobactin esterase
LAQLFTPDEPQSIIFGRMLTGDLERLIVEQKAIPSAHLKRQVIIDLYLPKNISDPNGLSLLLINDGQDLPDMKFAQMIDQLLESNQITPLICVGIHAGRDRRNEYGTARIPDYEGRGAKAARYELFVLEELLPFIHLHYGIERFRQKGFAGFSLGGLTALDMTWHHPGLFTIAGIFSGSLWWRSKSLEDDYDDDTDRIMHQQIRNGGFEPGLRFYFTTGSLDETADRNNNGIIDSIDDTLALIEELKKLGYNTEYDIKYLNFEDGKHDVATWGRAMPGFLLWGWGNVNVNRET